MAATGFFDGLADIFQNGFASDNPSQSSSSDTQAYFPMSRNVGGFVADVVLEEAHDDEMEVTQHPVEYGAPITDHAFKRPPRVHLRLGWGAALAGPGYIRSIYEQLLAAQFSRELITVVTGKRIYRNMLMTRLATHSDVDTENALMIDVELQYVILTQTVATTINPSAQADPASTSPTIDGGAQQAVPATKAQNESVLSQLTGAGKTPPGAAVRPISVTQGAGI